MYKITSKWTAPPAPTHPHRPPCPVWTLRWYEVEDLEQMSTANPMVQAKTHGFLRDNTYPIQNHRTIKNE